MYTVFSRTRKGCQPMSLTLLQLPTPAPPKHHSVRETHGPFSRSFRFSSNAFQNQINVSFPTSLMALFRSQLYGGEYPAFNFLTQILAQQTKPKCYIEKSCSRNDKQSAMKRSNERITKRTLTQQNEQIVQKTEMTQTHTHTHTSK